MATAHGITTSASTSIFVDRAEFAGSLDARVETPLRLDSSTSVYRLQRDFLDALAAVGRLQRFDARSIRDVRAVKKALSSSHAVLASFYEQPLLAECRLLQHTRGGLMLPGGFLGGWTFRDTTVNLVETERQQAQLRAAFGVHAPRLGVFAQRLAEGIFTVPSRTDRGIARQSSGVEPQGMHLVYAGRWIANKGLIQVGRALNLWPVRSARLTIIGDFEDDFQISQSDGIHLCFREFFRRELIARSPRLSIKQIAPMPQQSLQRWYSSADAFVCASFHEDEASGNAAHEAVLGGIPAVVTDWCGLGQLGRNTRGGAVATYSTLGGVRFSLAELRSAIVRAVATRASESDATVTADAEWVRDTFSPARMRASIRKAVRALVKLPAGPPPRGGWRCAERVRALGAFAPAGFRQAISAACTVPPNGLFIEGGGCGGDPSVSLPHLLQAIQSMYTTWALPPLVRRHAMLRGFWRVALWPMERALVEFGFPGPRLLRLEESEWKAVVSCVTKAPNGDIAFRVRSDAAARVLQRAVDLGYIVPDLLHDGLFERDASSVQWVGDAVL
jgi:glycosyltransferase involved in cell wall biosynthesis